MQSHMGHYGVVVRDGEERLLKVHNNVPHEVSVALSREDVVYAFPIACLVEGMRDAVLGGTEKSVQQGEIMVGSESYQVLTIVIRVSRP